MSELFSRPYRLLPFFTLLCLAASGQQPAPEAATNLPMSQRELARLSAQTKLAVRGRVLVDRLNVPDGVQYTRLKVDKTYRGKAAAGDEISFVCVCHTEAGARRDLLGHEVMVLLKGNPANWYAAGPGYLLLFHPEEERRLERSLRAGRR